VKRRAAGALLAVCVLAAAAPARAAVTAALSDSRIASGTTVQLTLTYDGLTTSEPQLAALGKDFDILGTSSSTSVQIGTGGSSETTQVVLTLAPKRTGRLTIPPIAWAGEVSPPLSLTVVGAGSGSNRGAGSGAMSRVRVFIVSRVSPQRPYVQAQVHLTVQIYTAERLYQADLNFAGNGAVLVKHVGTDQYSSAVRDGWTYQVITRRFVLFPLHSGRITLPGPVLNGEVLVRRPSASPWSGFPFGGFFSGMAQSARPIEVRGNPIVLAVRRRPAAAAGRYWLPASTVTLTAHFSPRTMTVRVGDPLTVRLDLQAAGLTAAQLPDLSSRLTAPAGVAAYPDQAKLINTQQDAGIVGRRDQTLAFIADHPGRYTLPPLRIRWWDTRTNQLRVATLPAQRLKVLPAAGAALHASVPPPAPAPAPARAPSVTRPPRAELRVAPGRGRTPWQWLTWAMAALWVATVGGWLWSRRRTPRPAPVAAPTPERPPRPDAASERTAFRAACERNDAPAARRHLVGWMAGAWGVPATSLNPLAAAIRDPQLHAELRELERACYGGAGWQGGPLAQALRELPARPAAARPGDDELPPLYP
jgi:hypothetical protein